MKKIGIAVVVTFLALLVFSGKLEGYFFKKESIGRVLTVDNSDAIVQGISKVGCQHLTVKVLTGKHKGKILEINNLLSGSIEYDEFYIEKDKVLMAVLENNGRLDGKVLSLLRMDKIAGLAFIFVILLIIYARKVGFKSLLSFAGSIIIIWEYLIPALRKGENVFIITVFALILLSALIIFLVAGFTRKGFSAFLGTMSGLFVTAALTFLFGDTFRIDGMNQPLAQSVVFSSFMSINILDIFYAAIVIGASGAAMDIAMDMTATIEELKIHNPDISRKALIKSGFNVGRSVIGTMTTTLLLAYSGGFLTLMILFMERNTTILQILNMKMVTSEIIKIIIGSIGLVVVAPITTYIASFIYSVEIKNNKNRVLRLSGIFFKEKQQGI
ncbi:YibE/F family protein [Fusobacterium sp.]|uniref:YibE/F family protein n=1 Tax=Fusobacterium sp. TaxID=68766 RepID=UPI0028FFED97|nr:YibE/F family protein [Fusobacterium sp.]MDU1910266.1 YibE/F family protein [Fusobacterium sp.]